MEAMIGTWLGEQGETFTLLFPETLQWSCVCFDKLTGVTVVQLTFDEELGHLWWGKGMAFFAKGAEVVANGRRASVRWYAAEAGTQTPRFVWTRLEEADTPPPHTPPPRQARNSRLGEASVAEAAERVTSEIIAQLLEQGGEGRIRLPHWKEQYHVLLGPLRDFLAARPDKFIVTTLKGSRDYTVAVVEPSATAKLDETRRCLAQIAVREILQQVTENGSVGQVCVTDWKERFSAHLGPLRSFLDGRPEFVVIPKFLKRRGKFNVALAVWQF